MSGTYRVHPNDRLFRNRESDLHRTHRFDPLHTHTCFDTGIRFFGSQTDSHTTSTLFLLRFFFKRKVQKILLLRKKLRKKFIIKDESTDFDGYSSSLFTRITLPWHVRASDLEVRRGCPRTSLKHCQRQPFSSSVEDSREYYW